MDNEIGIIGYNKKEVLKYTNFDIFMNKLFLFLLPILIEGCIFYILQINITHFLIQFFGINFVLYSTIALIIFKKNKSRYEYLLYIYFKNKSVLHDYYQSNNYLNECVNCILENNIKIIKDDNDYCFTIFKINNDEEMNIYNQLKDKYEIINH